MNKIFSKFVSAITVFALVLVSIAPNFAIAAGITTASDTMSRQKASTASNHTILFVTPSGVASGGIITLTFSSGFTGIGSMVGADFDFAEGSTGVCSSAVFTEKSVVDSAPTTAQFSVHGVGQVVTITSGGATALVTAGHCVRLKSGTGNATDTTGSGPATHQITNGATGGTDTITLAGSFGDTGTITLEITTEDSVPITATVAQTIAFSINVGTTNTGGVNPVALGTIVTTKFSDNSTVNSVWLNLATNASGGAIVSVASSNNGALKSTAVPADTIPWTGGTFTTPTTNTNYGDCVVTPTTTFGTLSVGAPFNSSPVCTHPGAGTNKPVALTTAAQTIITSSAPIAGGVAEVVVGATIYAATPAHTDYGDTQTFIATGTF